MRPQQISMALALMGILFSIVPASPASAAKPRLNATGHNIASTEPSVRVSVPEDAQYLGGKRWLLYGFADCEFHLYVEKNPKGVVQRLYWIQSEAYIPSRPELTHANDYLQSRKLELGGLAFHLDTWTRKLSDAAPKDSDLEQVEGLIAAKHLRLPEDMSFVRLVHLPDKAKRKELMIIYGERFDATKGPTPDREVVARMERAFTITPDRRP